MQTLEQLRSGALAGAKQLKLSCGLTAFPPQILDLAPTLEILDLTGNKLSHLPPSFAQLQNLRIAFFSDNDFTVFPEVLAQCPKLEMIGFKACQIREIPEGALPAATRWLILTNNHLEKLPASIGQCTRLQKLMLAGNRLKELPQELAHCQHLELLRISANALEELPAWLWSLPRLSWLAFAGNPCQPLAPNPAPLPTVPWPDLELEEQLGQGASGIISKAYWRRQKTHVAVKVFKGNITSDGLPQDEMSACMAAGAHPNLVQVLGQLQQHPAGKQGLVLSLIPPDYRNLGGPPSFATCTRDVYASGTVFPLAVALRIAVGMASVAGHLHRWGILHGDLYAHNTLVNGSGHPLFGDFGAATRYDRSNAALAELLERIEVRAYGYLLVDLLTHLSPQDQTHGTAIALAQLKEACLHPQVLHRPDFASIEKLLRSLPVAGE
ncbi:leucine-rich repeat-containing protein kinase family protein [Rufibacter immobilis]|uniref:leucine-rich repeat-containing protein kinase family protein n=1 Tax=Rufibacter immobilis TaxID=1348778 RepID=UPI0035F03FAD